jgi:hypothetical protein
MFQFEILLLEILEGGRVRIVGSMPTGEVTTGKTQAC